MVISVNFPNMNILYGIMIFIPVARTTSLTAIDFSVRLDHTDKTVEEARQSQTLVHAQRANLVQ